jgi:ABC-type sulfate transport system substrate-binding protein
VALRSAAPFYCFQSFIINAGIPKARRSRTF